MGAGIGAGSGGISSLEHEGLDTLPHAIAEDFFQEVTSASGLVTAVIWWTDSGKTRKIREVLTTYASALPSVVVTKQYDAAGALINGQTLTETITRSGGLITSIDGVTT